MSILYFVFCFVHVLGVVCTRRTLSSNCLSKCGPFLRPAIYLLFCWSSRTADCRLGRDVDAYSANTHTHTYIALLSLLQTLKPIAFSGWNWNTCRIHMARSHSISRSLSLVALCACWCRLQIQLYNSYGGHLYNCVCCLATRESNVSAAAAATVAAAAFLFCNHIFAAVLALLSVCVKCCPALIFMISFMASPSLHSFSFMCCFDHTNLHIQVCMYVHMPPNCC